MTITNQTGPIAQPTPLAIKPSGAHQAIWMLNSLIAERAISEDTGGAYAVLETWVTPDANPPPHVHANEDEAFLVLEGSLDVTVGNQTTSLGVGDFAFGPRGVPHTYAVTSGIARLLVISSPGGGERFFRAVGTPAQEMVIPQPQEPDVATVVDIAARHGITILLPPEAQ
jgi:quercetin dioxygenase-like cupin family protein